MPGVLQVARRTFRAMRTSTQPSTVAGSWTSKRGTSSMLRGEGVRARDEGRSKRVVHSFSRGEGGVLSTRNPSLPSRKGTTVAFWGAPMRSSTDSEMAAPLLYDRLAPPGGLFPPAVPAAVARVEGRSRVPTQGPRRDAYELPELLEDHRAVHVVLDDCRRAGRGHRFS